MADFRSNRPNVEGHFLAIISVTQLFELAIANHPEDNNEAKRCSLCSESANHEADAAINYAKDSFLLCGKVGS